MQHVSNSAATRVEGKTRNILRQIRTELAPGIPVMVVFVRHRSKKNEWLAILSTDLALTPPDIIRIYLCDEVGAIDWAIALQELVDLITEIATKAGKKISNLIQRQLQHWIGGLPNYIKAYLPFSCCES